MPTPPPPPPPAPQQPDWLAQLAAGYRNGIIAPGGMHWEMPPGKDSRPPPTAATRRRDCGNAPLPSPCDARRMCDALKINGNAWAWIYSGSLDSARALAGHVRNGRVGWRYAGQYTAVTRIVNGEVAVYVRHRLPSITDGDYYPPNDRTRA